MLDKVDKGIHKDVEYLSNTVNSVGLIYIYRLLNQTVIEYKLKKKKVSLYWGKKTVESGEKITINNGLVFWETIENDGVRVKLESTFVSGGRYLQS